MFWSRSNTFCRGLKIFYILAWIKFFWCGSKCFGVGQILFDVDQNFLGAGENCPTSKFKAGRIFYSCVEFSLKVD